MLARRHRLTPLAVCALALALSVQTAPAYAESFLAFPLAATTQSVGVEVLQATPSVAPDGSLRVNVAVTLTAPAEYVEVRLRLRGRSDGLLYQKTEVRADLPAGRHVISYDHDLGRLDLPQGRYPIEIRVLATGSEATNATSRLLVVDPDATPVPVAIVVNVSARPAVGIDGRFSLDPAVETGLRDDVGFLTQLALDRGQPLALAIPPVLLEQLARVAAGYETTAGVPVAAGTDVPTRYGRALGDLRSAVASGAIELVDVPYALPDLGGLESAGLASDLAAHWARTDAALAATLQSATAARAAYLGASLTPDALASLAERGTTAVVVGQSAVRSDDATATPGCYSMAGATTAVLVADDGVAASVADGADAFYDAIFDHLGDPECAVVLLNVGAGAANDTVGVQHALDWIAAVPWLEAVPLGRSAASARPTGTAVPVAADASGTDWDAVGAARTWAEAYLSATGTEDAEARAIGDATLVAESTLWGSAGADEAAALATSASTLVAEQFATIVVDAKDVTLSGRTGDVPFTLMNGTGKQLNLSVVATAEELRIRKPEIRIVAQPDENFITIPVDLRAIIADEMRVAVRSGALTVAETTVTVRASYLDQFATLGAVVIVLIVLLLFIRRRVGAGIAGTIADSDGTDV